MKILFVIDQIDNFNNETTMSALNYGDELRKLGHEIYYAGIGKEDKFRFSFKEAKFPSFIKKRFNKQEFKLAKPDAYRLEEIVKKMDLIHFFTPFKFSRETLRIAQEEGVPCTASFMVRPRDLMQAFGVSDNAVLEKIIFNRFRKFYNEFKYVHCQNDAIVEELKDNKYKSKMVVISNGIDDSLEYYKYFKPHRFEEKYVITMIGNYLPGKNQEVLIDAIYKSRYAKYIQLVLAGEGEEEERLKIHAYKLPNPVIFNYYDRVELAQLIGYTDLYVYTSDDDKESTTCMEAIALGRVPVISNGEYSAAKQLAIDKKSLFTSGDSEELARKIDFWIEHDTLKNRMEKEYASYMGRYKIRNCARKLDEMFRKAINN